jgi:hypothetical protein
MEIMIPLVMDLKSNALQHKIRIGYGAFIKHGNLHFAYCKFYKGGHSSYTYMKAFKVTGHSPRSFVFMLKYKSANMH